jgi:hypothetical protein
MLQEGEVAGPGPAAEGYKRSAGEVEPPAFASCQFGCFGALALPFEGHFNSYLFTTSATSRLKRPVLFQDGPVFRLLE